MNICIIGHGMMGRWHSEALLKRSDCNLHTLVGRKMDTTAAFAAEFGFKTWTTNLNDALINDEVDAVIIASPSENHTQHASACLSHNKHTLVEIPLAMSENDAERIVKLAKEKKLILGCVQPSRFSDAVKQLKERLEKGEENIRQMVGKFYTHRVENIGHTGYKRSWTDNLLWHHTLHLLDLGIWLLDQPVRRVHGFMPASDLCTGTPMDVFYGLETELDQSFILVGSYYSKLQIHEMLIVTDLDTYVLDLVNETFTSSNKKESIPSVKEANARVADDFISAIKNERETFSSGQSLLRSMRILQKVQGNWEIQHKKKSIPGRSVYG
ncbi:MAG: Gfo/Idh/MocA family oxidoreductase [Paracoccaceae bacterium]|nr:Gfo/Idh/MocA family oxidoreductase [Paracoccaceae bacterium]